MNTANIPESISESNIKYLIQIATQKHNSNQLYEAESIYKQIVQVQPKSTQIWFTLGNLYQVQGLLPEAEEAYKQAVALQPDAVSIYNNLGYTLQQQGKYDEAISCYRKALELHPNCTEASVNLGNTLHAQGQLSPENRLYYAALNHELGLRLKKAGDLKNAEACYNKAIELNPNYGEAYMCLGEIYQIQQNLKEAATVYRRGLKLINPHYAAAVEVYENAQTPQIVLVTPPIPQREVIVGNYSFPAIAPVTDGDERPFWSVVIPIYNRTDYLLQCLASVLEQWTGAEEMEILVIDNASTQPLFELVNEIGGGVVHYYRNPENIGAIRNFNTGIALSRGKWIHVLNDDDYVLPGFYAHLKQSLLECSDALGIAFTGYENVNEQGKLVYSPCLARNQRGIVPNWLQQIGVANPVNMCAVVIRREAHEQLGIYLPELLYSPDWELYKRIAIFYDCWYEPGTLACCREHVKSITSELLKTGTNITSILRAIEISESYLPVEHCAEITAKARNSFFNVFLEDAKRFLEFGDVCSAFRLMRQILKLDRSPQAVANLFVLLAQDEAAPLREEIVSQLFPIAEY
jgi:tetratricopeptide (TPR) repeat protein